MKRCVILLSAGCLCGIPPLHAQTLTNKTRETERSEVVRTETYRVESGLLAAKAHETLRWYFAGPQPAWTDVGWLREEADPIARARRSLRRRMYEESRQATDAAAAASRPRDPSIATDGLRITIGNNPDGSWSPYPDRALDARTIRFPLPRDARADKRTEQQKALDRLRSRK